MGVNDSFIKLYQHYDPDTHEMNEVNCNLKQLRVVPLTWPELEPLPPVPFSFPGMEATAELPFINHSISNIKDILVCIFRLFIQEPYLCCLSDKNLHGYCSISRASRIFSGGGGVKYVDRSIHLPHTLVYYQETHVSQKMIVPSTRKLYSISHCDSCRLSQCWPLYHRIPNWISRLKIHFYTLHVVLAPVDLVLLQADDGGWGAVVPGHRILGASTRAGVIAGPAPRASSRDDVFLQLVCTLFGRALISLYFLAENNLAGRESGLWACCWWGHSVKNII